MRKRLVLTCGVMLPALWLATAMAADCGGPSAAPEPQSGEEAVMQGTDQGAEEPQVGVPGKVPQTQIDIFNKREEARKRRDEGLKVRQQMIQGGQ